MYLIFHFLVKVFSNVTLSLAQFDSWSPESCMSDSTFIAPVAANLTSITAVESLFVATPPDSWSFQHFLDRVTHIVGQGAHLNLNTSAKTLSYLQNPYVLTGWRGGPLIEEMWGFLGFSEDHILHSRNTISAQRLISSCRAPLVHPWLSLRSLESFNITHGGVPIAQRKDVVYITRSDGQSLNGGRRVLNEDQLLEAMRQLLVKRGQNEKLVVFHSDAFSSMRETIDYFHNNARAVIGPHGGGMYHHRW